MTEPAILVLADGTVFEGVAFGAAVPSFGELVFNTSMSGYQEILSDPSYAGQIVTLTMPHIGNYGTNARDLESSGARAAGLVVRDGTGEPSNWRSEQSLHEWLCASGVGAIGEIDTRALTRRLRDGGVLSAAIAPGKTRADAGAVLEELLARPDYGQVDWVSEVATRELVDVSVNEAGALVQSPHEADVAGLRVAVLDFGVKFSILRRLLERGLAVTLVPPSASAADVLALNAAGVLVSNGPGDPAMLSDALGRLRTLAEATPTWGICLGHQLLAQAFGAKTFKLSFGHRGPNQPVLDRASGRVLITSQNHGYAVDSTTVPETLEVTQHNLNDGTIEGFRHRTLDVNAVQYHPEAGPGPNDAASFFDEFRDVLADRA